MRSHEKSNICSRAYKCTEPANNIYKTWKPCVVVCFSALTVWQLPKFFVWNVFILWEKWVSNAASIRANSVALCLTHALHMQPYTCQIRIKFEVTHVLHKAYNHIFSDTLSLLLSSLFNFGAIVKLRLLASNFRLCACAQFWSLGRTILFLRHNEGYWSWNMFKKLLYTL